jgi:choline kinase
MKAIILAAGRGSRLKGFTEEQPKCLNRVGGRTLIDRQLESLRGGGVNEVVIVAGYRSEMLVPFASRLVVNAEWADTNMVMSLLCARKEFHEPVVVSYSDILYGPSVVQSLVRDGRDAVVAYDLEWRPLWELRSETPLADTESFRITADGRILDIGRKVASLDEPQGQYMGIMRFSPAALTWITDYADANPTAVRKMDMTTLIRTLIEAGKPFHGAPVRGGWFEVDTTRDLETSERLLRDGRLSFQ